MLYAVCTPMLNKEPREKKLLCVSLFLCMENGVSVGVSPLETPGDPCWLEALCTLREQALCRPGNSPASCAAQHWGWSLTFSNVLHPIQRFIGRN
ncbi:hypothetical protein FKM82_001935 [Ascaphus truei]